jgi:glycosyltransferase involved in cell wall biosynthesis
VLLGYPDQFVFLKGEPACGSRLARCYLWAQFSRPPRSGVPAGLTAVPLTERTAEHLRRAQCRRIAAVIPHGVETWRFRPLGQMARRRLRARWGLGEAFVIGAVGAHTARKRLDLVLSAFALFARDRPGSLLLVKTDRVRSPEGTDLAALARQLGIAAQVRLLTGELRGATMAGLYNCFDLLLSLSEWEGFGIPVIEAMSCGVPVVTHPGQGPGEIIPYQELFVSGSLCREEEGSVLLEAQPEAAAAVLGRAAASPQLRLRLAEEGRREALRSFDIDAVALRWLKLIGPE